MLDQFNGQRRGQGPRSIYSLIKGIAVKYSQIYLSNIFDCGRYIGPWRKVQTQGYTYDNVYVLTGRGVYSPIVLWLYCKRLINRGEVQEDYVNCQFIGQNQDLLDYSPRYLS